MSDDRGEARREEAVVCGVPSSAAEMAAAAVAPGAEAGSVGVREARGEAARGEAAEGGSTTLAEEERRLVAIDAADERRLS